MQINGDGLQSRDFTFVGTVCDVIAEAITQRISHNGPVNLAFGTRTSLLEVIEILERIMAQSLQVTHREDRVGDVRHSQANNAVLQGLFPSINPVSLEEGLLVTVDWLRNYLAIK